MLQTRTAEATWQGDLTSGSGTIDYVGSGALSRMPVSWHARTEASEGQTSPEELLAAAHASCFSMAFASSLAKAGHAATRLSVQATVTFDKGEAGWTVVSSALRVEGRVPGIAPAEYQALAADAKDTCPISRALKGNVALRVEASLAD